MRYVMNVRMPESWKYHLAAVAVALLAGCGGGHHNNDGNVDCSAPGANRDVSVPGCPVVPALPDTMAVSLVDADGKVVDLVMPDRHPTLRAVIKSGSGAPLRNVVVTLSSTDNSTVFTPAVGSVLTDVNGAANIVLAPGNLPGKYVLTVSANVNGTVLTSTVNYRVVFPAVTFGYIDRPETLVAYTYTQIGIRTEFNGTQLYTPVQSVEFTSLCSVAGKAVIASPVNTVNGVAKTTYRDNGCGMDDVITASTVVNGARISKTTIMTVYPDYRGQVNFVSASSTNIALKDTGSIERPESSVVLFKVLGRDGKPFQGQRVNFKLSTSVGGLTHVPSQLGDTFPFPPGKDQGVTDVNGIARTTVMAGTVATPVRVLAFLEHSVLTAESDQLMVTSGVAAQNNFTLSSSMFNTEGWDAAGCAAPSGAIITARLGDYFNNPVPDGTAVSFTAEGGSIDASCLTGQDSAVQADGSVLTRKGTPGACSVRFCAGNPRPDDGRVTILAHALGEESFIDANGNDRFDAGESYVDLGEPFRNDRAVTALNANFQDDAFSSGNAVRVGNEPYTDSNSSGAWDRRGDGQYNGVLRAPSSVNTSPANTVHVRKALVQVLSTSKAQITPLGSVPFALDSCMDGTLFENAVRTFPIAIRDINGTVFPINRSAITGQAIDLPGNPLPAGTTIAFTASNGAIVNGRSFVVPNIESASAANWVYPVQMVSDVTQVGTVCQLNKVRSGTLTVTVTTPSGQVTTASFGVTD
jgi:hypothetical protein